MATTALRRGAWAAAALLSGTALAALGLRGHRPDAGFVRFEPRGVMVHLAPDRVTRVEVARDGRRWSFVRRAAGGWVAAPGSPAAAADPTEAIELGLRFLHGSAPQRIMVREEMGEAPLGELGLDPPRCTVSVWGPGPAPFVVELGGRNPLGLAQYARVAGREDVLLLDGYVGQQWEKATAPP